MGASDQQGRRRDIYYIFSKQFALFFFLAGARNRGAKGGGPVLRSVFLVPASLFFRAAEGKWGLVAPSTEYRVVLERLAGRLGLDQLLLSTEDVEIGATGAAVFSNGIWFAEA